MPEHNHITRDIKRFGMCPACDKHHEIMTIEIENFQKYDSEGSYIERES